MLLQGWVPLIPVANGCNAPSVEMAGGPTNSFFSISGSLCVTPPSLSPPWAYSPRLFASA